MSLDFDGPRAQLAAWEKVATDKRPRVASGWPALDGLLHRQSFGPGTFCILAGRLHTRKTAVALNLLANFLSDGVPCAFIALDEPRPKYVEKLASVITGEPQADLEEHFRQYGQQAQLATLKQTYSASASFLALAHGQRPTWDEMDSMMQMATVILNGERPRVVFIDYLSLLHREKFDGSENTRIPRLAENLAVWTRKHDVVTLALHQVGRQDDSQGRYHGDKPLTTEQLMHGGEQAADIILGTYRPAMDPVGNMTLDQALADGKTEQEWTEKRDRVLAYENDTMLQLMKNRPGVNLEHAGVRLRSVGQSQKMEVVP